MINEFGRPGYYLRSKPITADPKRGRDDESNIPKGWEGQDGFLGIMPGGASAIVMYDGKH
jgi:hypothetical protein